MVGWHCWLNGHEFEQAPGVGDGQKAWCAAVDGVAKSWTWLSDWTELKWTVCSVLWLFPNYRWENWGSEVRMFHNLQLVSDRCGSKPDLRTAVRCRLLPHPSSLSWASCSQCPKMGETLKRGPCVVPSLFTPILSIWIKIYYFRHLCSGKGGRDHV